MVEGMLLAVAALAWWTLSWRRAEAVGLPVLLLGPVGTFVGAILLVAVVGPSSSYEAVYPHSRIPVGITVSAGLMYILAPTWPLATIALSIIKSRK